MIFKVTVEYSYEVTEEELQKYYNGVDAKTAAQIDEENFQSDPQILLEQLESNKFTIKVEPAG